MSFLIPAAYADAAAPAAAGPMGGGFEWIFLVGFLVMTCTASSGAIVILTYSVVIYTSLGFSPFVIGIVTGVWSVLLAVGNFLGGIVADRIGRRPHLIGGLLACCFCLCMTALLTALYAGTDNKAGNNAATFFIFLFSLSYGGGIESPAFVYSSELFPGAWRPSGVAFSVSAVPFWGILFTGVASPAFEHIGWKFFMVFAPWAAVMAGVVFFYFPETKGHTLEGISEVFGDKIAHLENQPDGDSVEVKEPTHIYEEVKGV